MSKPKKIQVVNGWPNPHSLSKKKLANLVMDLQGILWAGEGGKPDMRDEWTADEIEHVADTLASYGMAPKEG